MPIGRMGLRAGIPMFLCRRFEEQLHERHDAEMRRLQAEEEKVMDIEREAQETRLKEKQVWREREGRVVPCVCACDFFRSSCLLSGVWGW